MNRFRTMAAVTVCALLAALGGGRAQYPCYAAPLAGYAPPPAQYYAGASYSFYQPTLATAYYAPYTAAYTPGYASSSYYLPRAVQPRYYNPGPYYYTPTYSYTPGYYSYYYTPGYFRY